jgi:hypothetical protein
MKTRIPIVILAVAALSLIAAGCFWQGPGKGSSFSLTFAPNSFGAKHIDGTADALRVYVMTGGALYPFGPGAHPLFDEVPFTAGMTYSSPAIPAGLIYSIMVVLGNTQSGVFTPVDYGSQDNVVITAGGDTSVSLTLTQSNYTLTALWGQNVTGVIGIGGTAYASTAQACYSAAGGNLSTLGSSATAIYGFPPAYSVNHISSGQEYVGTYPGGYYQPVPWLDTDKGILPYSLSTPGFVEGFTKDPSNKNVLESVSLNAPITSFLVAAYQRGAGLGGALVLPDGTPPEWIDIDLSQFLKGTAIYDIAAYNGYIYIATAFGAFSIPATVIQPGATADDVMTTAVFFTAGSAETVIESLALVIDTSGNGDLFMGTPGGIYSATINSATNAMDTPVLLPGTSGKAAATSLRAIQYYDNSISAYITVLAAASDYEITLYYIGTANLPVTLPFYSGLPADLPGEIKDFALFNYSSGTIYLLVAGKKGLVIYQAATYTPLPA